MAVPSNTYQSYQAIGNREDLTNIIYNVAPSETPFQSMIDRVKATNILHEWQTQALPAVNPNNAVVQGDDAVNQAVTPTVRLGNYAQTSEKTWAVTTMQEKGINKSGRKSEMAYQMEIFGRALKSDMETILLSNQAPVVGATSTAVKLRPLCGWITTNSTAANGGRGTGGLPGTSSTAATDGTQRAFTETLLRNNSAVVFQNSNVFPTVMMAGPSQRVALTTALTGGATKFYQVDDKKLVATVTVYDSDFGPLKIVPNRFQRNRDLWLLSPEYLALAFSEPMEKQDLAVTGLARRKQMYCSYTLEMRNEAAHSVIADLL